jgi:hypothetical protein
MQLAKKVLNKLNGLHYNQEYLCFDKRTFLQPLYVYLTRNNRVTKDITNQHLFVGYAPLVFAFPQMELPATVCLAFTNRFLSPNEFFLKKDAIAVLNLKKIREQEASGRLIVYYEGIHGTHHFIPVFHQFINGIYNRLYNKKPGNVFLSNNLYKQVQIAYAIPRNLSLISISSEGLFNLFPTDLNGQIDEEHYIISLRTGGKALEQVEKTGKALLSQVSTDGYKMLYAMGKNHMQELGPQAGFPFSQTLSATFLWPLPQKFIAYKELVLAAAFIHGIHKIMLFKIVNSYQQPGETGTLAHIHNCYASWRYKYKLAGNYLFR